MGGFKRGVEEVKRVSKVRIKSYQISAEVKQCLEDKGCYPYTDEYYLDSEDLLWGVRRVDYDFSYPNHPTKKGFGLALVCVKYSDLKDVLNVKENERPNA